MVCVCIEVALRNEGYNRRTDPRRRSMQTHQLHTALLKKV